jgi:hypothetical protein
LGRLIRLSMIQAAPLGIVRHMFDAPQSGSGAGSV